LETICNLRSHRQTSHKRPNQTCRRVNLASHLFQMFLDVGTFPWWSGLCR
jgi:hypothetical protein